MQYTPKVNDLHPTSISVEHKTSISFRVKACQDAYIYLSEYSGVTDHYAYEIIIGAESNQKLVS